MENKYSDPILHSVDAIYVVDIYCNVIYKTVYCGEEIGEDRIEKYVRDSDLFINISGEQNIFKQIYDEFSIMYVVPVYANEIFVARSIEAFRIALCGIFNAENISKNALHENFDKFIMLLNMFMHKGVVCEIDSDRLVSLVPKRTFENIKNIKMPKSFASYIFNSSFFNQRDN